MNLLAIDTSTETASVALMVKGQILSDEQPSQRHHAQYILPMIENLLNKSAVTIKQLDGLVFGRGPGSFTGLRIACSVIKGLAFAHDLPVYPVSSLAAIAQGVYSAGLNNIPVLAAIDARMNQVYWAYFNNMTQDPQEQVSSVSDIEIMGDMSFILAGWGYQNYKDQLPLSLLSRIKQEVTLYPKASEMIHLVKSGLISAVTAAEASPIYVRNQITQGEPRG